MLKHAIYSSFTYSMLAKKLFLEKSNDFLYFFKDNYKIFMIVFFCYILLRLIKFMITITNIKIHIKFEFKTSDNSGENQTDNSIETSDNSKENEPEPGARQCGQTI